MARNDVVNKDGSINWDEIGSHTDKINVLNGNVATNTNQIGILSFFMNVKSYGAKGDWNGTTGTDDTQAFLNAMAAVVSAGGGTLIIPKGNYLVTGLTWQNLNQVEIRGIGPSSVLVLKPGMTAKVLRFYGCSQLTLCDFTIQGNNGTLSPSYEYAHGVQMENSTDVNLINIHTMNCQGDGFNFTSGELSTVGTYCERVTMEDCRAINHFRNGVSITSGTEFDITSFQANNVYNGYDLEPNNATEIVNHVRIRGGGIRNPQNAGIVIVKNVAATVEHITVNTVSLRDCVNYGVQVVGGYFVEFDNVRVVNATNNMGFQVTNGSQGGSAWVKLIGCVARNTKTQGFGIQGNSQHVRFNECQCHGTTTQSGFYIMNANDVHFSNCESDGNSASGFEIDATSSIANISLDHCRAYGNGGNGVNGSGTTYWSGIQILNSNLNGNSQASINTTVSGATAVTLSNNIT